MDFIEFVWHFFQKVFPINTLSLIYTILDPNVREIAIQSANLQQSIEGNGRVREIIKEQSALQAQPLTDTQ